jgi:hypothetical protein
MAFSILYPERRVVDSETILTWYQDALANGEVEDDFPTSPTDPHWAALLLHEAGLITLTTTTWCSILH